MSGFFASGHVVDMIVVIMLAEAAWLMTRRGAGKRFGLLDALCTFGPGMFILLALRAALTGMDWPWIALPLAVSFPLHLLDLARRRSSRN
jgi:predicted small integral membrane protein